MKVLALGLQKYLEGQYEEMTFFLSNEWLFLIAQFTNDGPRWSKLNTLSLSLSLSLSLYNSWVKIWPWKKLKSECIASKRFIASMKMSYKVMRKKKVSPFPQEMVVSSNRTDQSVPHSLGPQNYYLPLLVSSSLALGLKRWGMAGGDWGGEDVVWFRKERKSERTLLVKENRESKGSSFFDMETSKLFVTWQILLVELEYICLHTTRSQMQT
jgi:hypothetical protein